MEPHELNNRQNYVGDEGCFGGCILPLFALPFMVVLLPFIIVYTALGGK